MNLVFAVKKSSGNFPLKKHCTHACRTSTMRAGEKNVGIIFFMLFSSKPYGEIQFGIQVQEIKSVISF